MTLNLGGDLELPHIPIKSPPCNFEFVQVCRYIIHVVQTILTYINTYFPLWISFVEHMQQIHISTYDPLGGVVWQGYHWLF